VGQKIMIRELRTDELEKLVNLAAEHAKDANLISHNTLDRTWFKKNMREMMIAPEYKIFVYVENDLLLGYCVAGITTMLWNKTLLGDIDLFFIHPSVRNKHIADDLINACEDWFEKEGCAYYLTGNLMYDADYQPNEKYLNRSRTYFTRIMGMQEVGYNFVKRLGEVDVS
jgi:GNAT superfamily N-acetyltransferase